MTLALIALAVLAIVIFGFVIEPVLRARGDRTVLDAVALPERDGAPAFDESDMQSPARQPGPSIDGDDRQSGRRMTIDRPAGSGAS